MDRPLELVPGCRRLVHIPGYASHSRRKLSLDPSQQELLDQFLRHLDQAFPNDFVVETPEGIWPCEWFDLKDLEDDGIKGIVVEPLQVSVVFWPGTAQTEEGLPLLWVIDYLHKAPDDFTRFDRRRLQGLTRNVAQKYDTDLQGQ